jgi:cytochrome o ubiquinol oxidase operon protein cyoD
MNGAHSEDTGAGRGSVGTYVAGFMLSVALTVIPFGLVMSGILSGSAALFAMFGAAVVQIIVHLHYFLHLGTSSTARWNVLALLFTMLVMTLFVAGTIWIMYHLHYRLG